ncbi:hypothetical protein PB1_12889 [Bacillus methanolicus PB1]|uniref:Uncharacterized protein n=1 Tax=Bacillus methanolicus PB1 TaxID=997296 RepID=I3DW33_BACMT|nr:hypothetical protein PB1_12889 [Bacillus methanolicus PB1]
MWLFRLFVKIRPLLAFFKVDREERPDIDSIYMNILECSFMHI